MNVLLLTRYGRMGASSRLRTLQYVPWLEAAGMTCTVQALFSDEMLQAKYQAGGYRLSAVLSAYGARLKVLLERHEFDLVWIEKEALPWLPAWAERLLLRGTPYVLDFDDAIFHNYDNHRSPIVRRLLGRRIDRLMNGARLVIGGNEYLARRAREAGARWVETMSTVVDLERYVVPDPACGTHPRFVWVGSPSTARYLEDLRQPLTELASRCAYTLRVIGSNVDLPGVSVECVTWTEATEVKAIAECDIGLMPLADTPWEKGKCGYKLIQYMACGLPVVASPIGVNSALVQEGENGYLAASPDEWVSALWRMINDAAIRRSMGAAGRQRVESQHCLQRTAPRLCDMLFGAAGYGGVSA
ncbi:sugar transferase, PEP-CTERM/EpsH1 system associated [Variovorax sp. PBL-H6]|uniref:glycosyltransferase family 4 protein n=1 Tax=Variovorax sp. PBL-H6 TaxID=434009 RepID=UPI00131981CD|nr:glycosyltransferase family 4 protein [Variovorax sp. PBL-H6]VTU38653.1 sugar transferase, PEP-CTERM/EpsH1 system associated [Variovorax sp. PBL-H6]